MTTSPSFDSFMQQGLSASHGDDLAGAVSAWERAAAFDPSSALPHFLMGAEFAQAKLLDRAEAAYANAVLLSPQFETARFQLGLLQFTSGRPAMAQVTWEPLFQLEPSNPFRAFVLGFSALARDDFTAATGFLEAGMLANKSNLPLNRDIRQVLAAIDSLTSGTPSAAVEGAEEGHVLLAAYRQQGTSH